MDLIKILANNLIDNKNNQAWLLRLNKILKKFIEEKYFPSYLKYDETIYNNLTYQRKLMINYLYSQITEYKSITIPYIAELDLSTMDLGESGMFYCINKYKMLPEHKLFLQMYYRYPIIPIYLVDAKDIIKCLLLQEEILEDKITKDIKNVTSLMFLPLTYYYHSKKGFIIMCYIYIIKENKGLPVDYYDNQYLLINCSNHNFRIFPEYIADIAKYLYYSDSIMFSRDDKDFSDFQNIKQVLYRTTTLKDCILSLCQ